MNKSKLVLIGLLTILYIPQSYPQNSEIISKLNIFEQLYNQISGFLGIPNVKLQTKTGNERVLIIDYEMSYYAAKEQLEVYRDYSKCVEQTYYLPMPQLKLIGEENTADQIIDSYSRYVDKLITYITTIRIKCLSPVNKEIRQYKDVIDFSEL